MKKSIRCIILAAVILITTNLQGCFFSFGYSISFTVENIYTSVGETVDLSRYIEGDFGKHADEIEYRVAEGNIGLLSDCKFDVLDAGEALIEAKFRGRRDYVEIISSYDKVSSLKIDCDKGRVVEPREEAAFRPIFNTGAVTNEVSWYLNGEKMFDGMNFYFTPDKEGDYTVSAKTGDISAEYRFVVAKSLIPTFSFEGETYQDGEFSRVIFRAEGLSDDVCYIEWFVNGEGVYQAFSDESASYEFTPSQAGIYSVSCKVNGYPADCLDEQEVRVVASGPLPLKNAMVDFDTSYPDVYFCYDAPKAKGEFLLNIDGESYSSRNYPERFGNGKIDISEWMDITRDSTIKLSYNGNGIYEGNELTYDFTGIKEAALPYLSRKYFGGNYYMTSDMEVFDIFSYAMTFRPQTSYSKGYPKLNLRLYMAYSSQYNPTELANMAWNKASQTGSFYIDANGSTSAGKVFEIEISFITPNIPTDFSLDGKQYYDSLNIPHVSSEGRSSQVLPIDSYPLSYDKIETSEELFYVVNEGYSPNIEYDSSAERLYNEARRVVCAITDDDMTSVQIAHAVFDYIMWKVSYDYSVAEQSAALDVAVLQPAFYLDGVLDTGYAVCDGIAKTYSLLCNMAGVRCVRVVGSARTGGTMAAHAWNKVKIDEEWYIVDATWSDLLVNINHKKGEIALHKYFLISDSSARLDHVENDSSLYPRTAELSYDFYDGGADGLFRLKDNLNFDNDIKAIADYVKNSKTQTYYVDGQKYDADCFMIEIKADEQAAELFEENSYSRFKKAIAKAGLTNQTFVVTAIDDVYAVIFV